MKTAREKIAGEITDDHVRVYKEAFNGYMSAWAFEKVQPPTPDVGFHACRAGLEAVFRALGATHG